MSGTLKRVKTPVLEVAYEERGPTDGPPVLLLHGFPDDVHGWDSVAAALASAGRRVIAPSVRGFGPTKFLAADTLRDGQFAALGQDVIDLVEALDLNGLTVVGQDWGSPAAEILTAFRPERVARLVKLNHYGIYSMAEMAAAFARGKAANYGQLHALWYVWLLNLGMGEQLLGRDRRGLCRALWDAWSPTWDATARAAAFEAVAPSFDNPDFDAVVLSAYRHGVTEQEGRDPRYAELAKRLQDPPPVAAPTVLLSGADDGVEKTPLTPEAVRMHFTGPVRQERLAGVGHFPQRERSAAVVEAVVEAVLGEVSDR